MVLVLIILCILVLIYRHVLALRPQDVSSNISVVAQTQVSGRHRVTLTEVNDSRLVYDLLEIRE